MKWFKDEKTKTKGISFEKYKIRLLEEMQKDLRRQNKTITKLLDLLKVFMNERSVYLSEDEL